ncbi:MAG: bacteriohemerythrin [Thiothrix sp.]|uniref:bacteriohemerythrin n=1 Tax=Thiothrix sp. TaxID=1032 RepID=UPI0026032771|nr:bacteriohemerythrin [Thiothrix sp.]MDD5395062.1 bacteriohemerythrin [Thiothrix sp.]
MTNAMKLLGTPLLMGTLLVAAILTFFALGVGNPVPWLLTLVLFATPFYSKWRENEHFVVWRDEYSVGIAEMDDDHRKLLNLINHLQTAIHYQTGEKFEQEALDELMTYTRYHFQREEALMQQYGYPDLEVHQKLHQEMVADAEAFVKDYRSKGYKALAGVADYLKNWLVNHINGTDKEYSAFILQKTHFV